MKLDKRDRGSNFRTYCTRHTTHRLGEIPGNSFELPSEEDLEPHTKEEEG
ncbi:hypothetical protein [Allocoleopsis franciscana]|uniref:Uncharacterized protein n=1 Tax=Allocoleopsis franciscana PCC 7113 TaxID=1173027 RepID=K9WR58_9CYAN|nr:hypothetical protein [Allocoleopsis franciscana]AFZ22269.1 hypothetical protein Mic7113_6706 [Allocoleopsis franciscana PCC 7113]